MLVNLTPHDITIRDAAGEVVENIPPSGQVARCAEVSETMNLPMVGQPVRRISYGDVEGLPPFDGGVYYIVSAMVRMALPDRKDLLSPDTIREGNKVNGCKGFISN